MKEGDLAIVVPDKNTSFLLKNILNRHQSLRIQPITFAIFEHPNRDGGVRTSGARLLEVKRHTYTHGLVVIDFEGSGVEHTLSPEQLEQRLREEVQSTWRDNGNAIVLEPEADIWTWGSDAKLQEILGWQETVGIREWLKSTHNLEFDEHDKPLRPKEAMELLVRKLRLPRSSSLYGRIAAQISLKHCSDNAFQKLRTLLQGWFPI